MNSKCGKEYYTKHVRVVCLCVCGTHEENVILFSITQNATESSSSSAVRRLRRGEDFVMKMEFFVRFLAMKLVWGDMYIFACIIIVLF